MRAPHGGNELRLSIAFVEKITLRTSTSNARNGTNSAQAVSHSRMIPGYFAPHAVVNSLKRSRAAASLGAVYSGRRALAIGSPVVSAGEAERVPDEMQHAGLHDRQRPRRRDPVGEPFQSVAADDAHVGDATVLDLGEHRQPVLRSYDAGSVRVEITKVAMSASMSSRFTPASSSAGPKCAASAQITVTLVQPAGRMRRRAAASMLGLASMPMT